MNKRSLISIGTAATVFAAFITIATPAVAQGRGAQPRKPKPAVGAWGYKGDPQPPASHAALTGVLLGGAINDISNDTLPGEQLVLARYGGDRYNEVDDANDP